MYIDYYVVLVEQRVFDTDMAKYMTSGDIANITITEENE